MHEPRADRLGPDKFYKGSSQGKPGTDGKFRVLGSATELPRVATPVSVCEMLTTEMVEKRPTFDKVAENGPPVPGFCPRLPPASRLPRRGHRPLWERPMAERVKSAGVSNDRV